MKTQHKPQTQEEVLALFRERKISTQKAADLLGMSSRRIYVSCKQAWDLHVYMLRATA